ncbi:uroporphyrinogen-III synthase [Endozoicomonas sp. OPT23]|uniref:uroporphyrinogen-III synthase n=1 Tax=Endozoicomonas sp. OPT23 TaxID=2072845 RepID=UPI00129A72E5|nr:uroporphyrinogen-III synthase [Endozoicomonas sp. OPT23]MRI31592.1 uroporphyrinogen-III synthase [Endozoicomonas sp. OPT23]
MIVSRTDDDNSSTSGIIGLNNIELSHIRALVTRPKEQAKPLAELIQQQSGQAWVMPMMTIEPYPESQAIRSRVLELDQYHKVIVISHHAARLAMEHIEVYWPQLPIGIQWYAIGEKTRATLDDFDVASVCPKQALDSETLLSLPDFQSVAGEKVLLIKGKGGRDLLRHTLADRGAQVDELELYQRQRPEYSCGQLSSLIKEHRINVILASSGEILANTAHYLSSDFCEHCHLIVPSKRVEALAINMGFTRVHTAEGASNNAMLSAMNLINSEGLS